MSKILYASDLHLELNGKIHKNLLKSEGDVLILAGDVTCARYLLPSRTDADSRSQKKHLLRLRDDVFSKFKKVFYVMGNHEHYGFFINRSGEVIKQFFDDNNFSNVHFLQDDGVVYENTLYVGGTLWTDIQNPVDAMCVEQGMNDYRVIYDKDFTELSYVEREIAKTKNHKANVPITVETTNVLHHKSLTAIMEYIKMRLAEKVIVITHHAPSFKSVHSSHAGNALNSAYATNLSNFILNYDPDYWIHGHTHYSTKYEIGKTQVLSSQAGYKNYEPINWEEFNPGVIEYG